MEDLKQYKKAHHYSEIDNAVRINVPINAEHEFYTDFSDVRGDFEEKVFFRALNVNYRRLELENTNPTNKALIFLAGMRGSGKTSELAKISRKLTKPEAFFPITCNIDDGLDLNDMEYMDILIFQLERLFEELSQQTLLVFDEDVIASFQSWFSERISEANKVIKKEGGFEVKMTAGTPSLLSFLGITTKVKANIAGSKENAQKIRTVLRNNFSDFAKKFNEFIEYVSLKLRDRNIAKELLFIIDGLEKTSSLDIRRKIIFEESNRIRLIKANTIFTLPVELMSESQRLTTFSTVISFPFVKIREKNGDIVEKAVERFVEFTYKRIDPKLFENEQIVRKAILMGGGSPREYLRILEYTSFSIDEEKGVIDMEALDKAIKKLAAQTAQYINEEELEVLAKLKKANAEGTPLPFSEKWQDLLEKLIVLEYNDGTYKRVNPVVEASRLYKHYVGE
ncbi:MAG: hypothetical protein KDD99_13360 [Bacteroidetes bacterium]|nr:hypothetical protein [Bacteroidota bacterium]